MSRGARALLVACVVAMPLPAAAFSFVPGHIYTTDGFSRRILEFDAGGRGIGSLTLPEAVGTDLRGLAFGPDGRLYVVAARAQQGFVVVAIDHCGTVQATYRGGLYVAGNTSYGKIAVAGNAIYVTGQNSVATFVRTRPGAGSTLGHGNNQVFDVAVLPSGNVLVASAYEVEEVTATGTVVRRLQPTDHDFVDTRGVEHDPVGDDIFVSQLGYSNHFDEVLRLDGASGEIEASTTFSSPNDLFRTADGELLVTSYNFPPRRYSRDLVPLGQIGGSEQAFVTAHPVSPHCGDGRLDPLEVCDDGNAAPGDGCDAHCAREAVHIGVTPGALTVVEGAAVRGGGSIRFSAHDPGIAKGSGTGTDAVRADITIAYGNGASTGHVVLPDCDPGWLANDDRRALYASAGELARPRTAAVEHGTRLRLEARGLGDPPLSITGLSDPQHSVLVAYCLTNGGADTCLCSAFPRCRLASSRGRTRLTCRDGVADPTCAALGR